jgi:hypothetical protein
MLQKACSNLRKTERMLELCQEKKRSFKEAFKSAKDSGKSSFLWKGNPYSTKTKSELESGSKMGKFKKRFDQTGNDESKKKESVLGKFKSSKTGSEFFSKLKKKK